MTTAVIQYTIPEENTDAADATAELMRAANFAPALLALDLQTAREWLKNAETCSVVSANELAAADKGSAFAHTRWRELEDARVALKAPVIAKEKLIDNAYRELLDLYEQAARLLATKAANRRAELAAEKKQLAQVAAQAYSTGDVSAATTAIVRTNALVQIDDKPQKLVWVADIIEGAKVPAEWRLGPDEKRIKQMAKATPSDQRPIDIPGVVYRLEPVVRLKGVGK